MANGNPPVGRGFAGVLTAVAVIGFFVFVAIAINTYDTDEAVQSVRTSTPTGLSGTESNSQAAPPAAPPEAAPPVGGIATGAGGTATDRGSLALPVSGALAALALLGAARKVGRRREA